MKEQRIYASAVGRVESAQKKLEKEGGFQMDLRGIPLNLGPSLDDGRRRSCFVPHENIGEGLGHGSMRGRSGCVTPRSAGCGKLSTPRNALCAQALPWEPKSREFCPGWCHSWTWGTWRAWPGWTGAAGASASLGSTACGRMPSRRTSASSRCLRARMPETRRAQGGLQGSQTKEAGLACVGRACSNAGRWR